MSDLAERISSRLRHLGLAVSDGELSALVVYFGLLTKWNKTVNLTSVDLDPPSDEAIDRLLAEPVVASSHLHGANGLLVDIGSGGGSPAIPLRILNPQVRLVMIESKARKGAFLREAIRHLGLSNAEVLTARFEDAISRRELARQASWVSFRAVRADRDHWNHVDALASPTGQVLWFRSDAEPLNVADFAPQFRVRTRQAFTSPLSGEVVVLARQSDTPAKQD